MEVGGGLKARNSPTNGLQWCHGLPKQVGHIVNNDRNLQRYCEHE